MGQVQFFNNKILFTSDGKIAMDSDCCCGASVTDCNDVTAGIDGDTQPAVTVDCLGCVSTQTQWPWDTVGPPDCCGGYAGGDFTETAWAYGGFSSYSQAWWWEGYPCDGVSWASVFLKCLSGGDWELTVDLYNARAPEKTETVVLAADQISVDSGGTIRGGPFTVQVCTKHYSPGWTDSYGRYYPPHWDCYEPGCVDDDDPDLYCEYCTLEVTFG